MKVPLKSNKFSVKVSVFFQKKKKKKLVNVRYLKTLQHIDDFGVSNATDKIPMRGWKLDFGPTQLHENP